MSKGICRYTNIETTEGSLWIQKIVVNKLDRKVLALTQDNMITWDSISAWKKSPPTEYLYKITLVGGSMHRNGEARCIVSPDQLLVTQKGLVAPGELDETDLIATARPHPGPRAEQVILGSLAGDGSINSRGRYREGHCIAQKEYSEFKIRLLSPLSPNSRPGNERDRLDRLRETTHRVFQYTLDQSPYFHLLRSEYYPNGGRKITPKTYIEKLGPQGIAVWYSDDGTLGRGKRAHFALGNRTEQEAKLFQLPLLKYGIESKIFFYKNKCQGQWRLSLDNENSRKLFLLIAEYTPPTMRYKLSTAWDELPKFNPQNYEPEPSISGWSLCKVKKFIPLKRPQMYSLELNEAIALKTPAGAVFCGAR